MNLKQTANQQCPKINKPQISYNILGDLFGLELGSMLWNAFVLMSKFQRLAKTAHSSVAVITKTGHVLRIIKN
jgi:hypothetical protein